MPFTYEQGVEEAVMDYLHSLPPREFLSLLVKAKRFDVIQYALLSMDQPDLEKLRLGDTPAGTKASDQDS